MTAFKQKRKSAAKSNLEKYLASIRFDERSCRGDLSDEKLKKILFDNLRRYFQGKVSQGFIFDLSAAIYEECPENDDLLTAICMIEDVRASFPQKTLIEKVFLSALNILKK